MEENKKSLFQLSLMPGILLGLALIVFSLIMYLLDVDRESKLMWLSFLIMAAGLFWSMIAARDKEMNGLISYGNAFGIGFFTVLIASILATIFTYIHVTQIDPGIIEDIIINAEEEMMNNEDMSDEQIEQGMAFVEKFIATPVAITIMSFVFNIIAGVVLSLIIAIFAKREDKSLA